MKKKKKYINYLIIEKQKKELMNILTILEKNLIEQIL